MCGDSTKFFFLVAISMLLPRLAAQVTGTGLSTSGQVSSLVVDATRFSLTSNATFNLQITMRVLFFFAMKMSHVLHIHKVLYWKISKE